jgi:hypothetical protein
LDSLSQHSGLDKIAISKPSAPEDAAMRKLGFAITMLVAFALGPAALAQSAEGLAKALHIYDNYRVVPNITYLTANNWDAKLDLYQARDAKGPNPTLIYFHGGGWVQGSKASAAPIKPMVASGTIAVPSPRSFRYFAPALPMLLPPMPAPFVV